MTKNPLWKNYWMNFLHLLWPLPPHTHHIISFTCTIHTISPFYVVFKLFMLILKSMKRDSTCSSKFSWKKRGGQKKTAFWYRQFLLITSFNIKSRKSRRTTGTPEPGWVEGHVVHLEAACLYLNTATELQWWPAASMARSFICHFQALLHEGKWKYNFICVAVVIQVLWPGIRPAVIAINHYC